MDEWNRPIPVRKWLSLTQAVRDERNPTGLELVLRMKTWSLDVFSQYSTFHLWFVYSKARMPSPARLFKRLRAPGTNGCLNLSLSWRASENTLKRPYKIRSGSANPRQAKESVASSRRSSTGWMPESMGKWSVGMKRRHPVTMCKASFKTLSMRRV